MTAFYGITYLLSFFTFMPNAFMCRPSDLQQLWGLMFRSYRPKAVEQPSSWS